MARIFTFLFCIFSIAAFAQVSVTGKVTDKEGAPLLGAIVVENGTNNAVVVNDNGEYSIVVRGKSSELQARLVGYNPQNRIVGDVTTILFTMSESSMLEQVMVVGSRSLNRTSTNSVAPIDVIDIATITNSQGQLDVNQLLQFVAPSFNANRQSGADGADHVDPASLRGLGPDQTLVLVNGKRRHQSSLVNIYGTRGRGNTGTDLNAIPAAAIERIEILRDGAAAQYGSDAIAGVINIVLKKSIGFTGNANVGAHSAKDNPDRDFFDGENVQLNANYGFAVGEKGFINVTGDYWYRGHTNRNDPSLYRQKFGDAQGANFNTTFNMELPISDNATFYAFGGNSFRQSDAYAWTRDAGSSRTVNSIYPDGYNPRILADIKDRSMAAGVRGNVGKWGADFSHSFGLNRFHYFGAGTLNASLEDRSPTNFDDGGFQLQMNTTNLDFTRYFADVFAGSNIAFGMEHRIENYQIFAGEEASWKTYGPVIFSIDSTYDDAGELELDTTYRPGGAQGFPGFGPQNEVNRSRTNLGAYIDGDFNLTEQLTVVAAARFERYSDFGNTINGKLGARFQIDKHFALRATGGTGFRAPSLPQIYFNSVYTDFVSGVATDKYLAANGSNITRVLGIEPLKQETSVNVGGGFTANFNKFSATVDGYLIQIKDRIVLTGDFSNEDPQIGADLRALNVASARFFANAINTSTTGLDIVLAHAQPMSKGRRFSTTLAANINNMTIDQVNTSAKLAGKEDSYLSNRERLFILASAPPLKGNLTLQYGSPKLSTTLRFTYFHKMTLEDYVGALDVYKARFTTDLSLNLSLTEELSLTVGASNLLNAYPTKQDAETEGGGLYDPVQMGFNGRFLFSRFNWRF